MTQNQQTEEFFQMGKCPSCKEEWTMTAGEHSFFQKLVERKTANGEEFSMPTHCRTCRESKRKVRIAPTEIISKVEEMANRAFNGDYNFEDEKLTEELRQVVKMLRSTFSRTKREKREHVENTESVGQSAASGSDQVQS